VYAVFGLW